MMRPPNGVKAITAVAYAMCLKYFPRRPTLIRGEALDKERQMSTSETDNTLEAIPVVELAAETNVDEPYEVDHLEALRDLDLLLEGIEDKIAPFALHIDN
jgi:hypothetical protein